MKEGKKAVSPLVSTILLVMIVIVIALIIITWSGVFFQEAITKEIAGEKKSADKYCSEIGIEPFVNQDAINSFGFKNTGNVPIYSYKVKLLKEGSSQIIQIPSAQGGIVNPGYNTIVKDPNTGSPINYASYEQIKIIPIILGKSKGDSTQQFTCPESSSFII